MEDLRKLGEIGVFVINLRTRPERWELFQQRVMRPLDLSVEVLRPEPHSLGRVGCFESHRTLWRLTVERNLDCALIFEDDCALSTSFTKEQWKQALEEAATLSWDFFFLGYLPLRNSRSETLLAARFMAPHTVEFRPQYTHAYLARRAGCLKALARATPDAIQRLDVDDYLVHQESLRLLCAAPLLFQQGGGIASDVDATRSDPRFLLNSCRHLTMPIYALGMYAEGGLTWLKFASGAPLGRAVLLLCLLLLILLSGLWVRGVERKQHALRRHPILCKRSPGPQLS